MLSLPRKSGRTLREALANSASSCSGFSNANFVSGSRDNGCGADFVSGVTIAVFAANYSPRFNAFFFRAYHNEVPSAIAIVAAAANRRSQTRLEPASNGKARGLRGSNSPKYSSNLVSSFSIFHCPILMPFARPQFLP